MKNPPLLIWGASGHARVVADIVRRQGRYEIAGFVDDINPQRAGEIFCAANILGGREVLPPAHARGVAHLVVAIGDNAARLTCAAYARGLGFTLAWVVHPSAVMAADARVGEGTVIAAGAIVNPATTIGDNVIINTAASVDHECVIQDGAHISPGVRLGGGVRVGRGAWIGIGATVKDHVTIGDESILGAGAVVLKNIPPRVVAYGVPARVVRKLE